VLPHDVWDEHRDDENLFPLFSPEEFKSCKKLSSKLNVVVTDPEVKIELLKDSDPVSTLIMFRFDPAVEPYAADNFLIALEEDELRLNVILSPAFHENNKEDLQIKAAALLGRYVIDKRVTGISLTNTGEVEEKEATAIAFSILQCTETRITRTMYLSCPTCGRTKFNLQEAVKMVKEATGHLKGLKIAVMGCIVNGPGEMAGADYGYVGAAEGKVHIYKGTVPVLKNVPEENAVEQLLKFIEQDRQK
jgi:(E)-4-hydroxy-3-methylbut-2-enyl-diphosphate synthase